MLLLSLSLSLTLTRTLTRTLSLNNNLIHTNLHEECKLVSTHSFPHFRFIALSLRKLPLLSELHSLLFSMHSQTPFMHVEYGSLTLHSKLERHFLPREIGNISLLVFRLCVDARVIISTDWVGVHQDGNGLKWMVVRKAEKSKEIRNQHQIIVKSGRKVLPSSSISGSQLFRSLLALNPSLQVHSDFFESRVARLLGFEQ